LLELSVLLGEKNIIFSNQKFGRVTALILGERKFVKTKNAGYVCMTAKRFYIQDGLLIVSWQRQKNF
jgi:hypothetical protein